MNASSRRGPEAEALPARPVWMRAAWLVGAALVVSVALQVLVVAAYRIPSDSMEETLRVGDFVLVSKLKYGPRLPVSLPVPFTDRRIGGGDPGFRLPGFGKVERGDVIVFNVPTGPGSVEGRRPYVKRVIGLPGDTVQVQRKRVIVNGDTIPPPPDGRLFWRVTLRDSLLDLTPQQVRSLGFTGRLDTLPGGAHMVEGTRSAARQLRDVEGVRAVEPYVRPAGDATAPFPIALRYSLDTYGPLRVPHAGWRMALTEATWQRYRSTLERHEGLRIERTATGFVVNDRPAETVTFKNDYLFVLGDHRDDSADSRTWGFVPMNHVIGTAVLVYLSWDESGGRLRWDRLFRRVE